MLSICGKESKFFQNVCPVSLLSTTDNLFEKVIQKIVQEDIKDIEGLINASQLGFHDCHSMTFQCMRLTVCVI
jgi:hypothetical protein